jgi:hypothetical protein
MRASSRTLKNSIKPLAAILVGLLVLLDLPLGAQSGKGASVVVTMRNREQVSGELIAVKGSSFLLLDRSGSDRSLDLAEVVSVRVVRRSKAGVGALLGLGIGLGAGAAAASEGYSNADPCESAFARAGVVALGGLVGIVIGAVTGGSAGRDLAVVIPETDGPARTAALSRLRKYARSKNSG